MEDENSNRHAPPEGEAQGFLSYYLRELKALCHPATPLFVTAIYCLVVSLAYYYRQHACQLTGRILCDSSTSAEAGFTFGYGVEGLWYVAGPCLAVCILAVVTALLPRATDMFPQCGLRDFGMCAGSLRGWKDSAIFLAIVLPVVVLVAFRNDFSDYYPLSRLARTSAQWFFAWQAIQFLYFIGWEFLNRGFLLLGLETTMGRWSILAAAVPFCILHFGKPGLETFASFFVAIALGWLTLRARSILPATVIHWAWTFTLDTAVVLRKAYFQFF
jgi:membrane protease YdiL (CAAX protease family)